MADLDEAVKEIYSFDEDFEMMEGLTRLQARRRMKIQVGSEHPHRQEGEARRGRTRLYLTTTR